VPEQQLNRANVGSGFQQMDGIAAQCRQFGVSDSKMRMCLRDGGLSSRKAGAPPPRAEEAATVIFVLFLAVRTPARKRPGGSPCRASFHFPPPANWRFAVKYLRFLAVCGIAVSAVFHIMVWALEAQTPASKSSPRIVGT
jgi:hypothetical protein